MSEKPVVSVVIPTFNRRSHVQKALHSVLSQTYTNYEVIIIDDGSTDGTGDAIRGEIAGLRGNGGNRIRYFFQANQGSSIARNRGIEEAVGEWIAFLDSDDIWLPEKLELQLRALRQFDECGACFTDSQMVNDDGMNESSFRRFGRPCEGTVGIASKALVSLARCFCGYWLSTLLVRTDLAQRIGGFDPEIQAAEDRDFYFRLAIVTRLACIDKPLVRTDRSASIPGSNCRPWDKWNIRLRSHQRVYEKWLKLAESLQPDVRRAVELDLRSVHSHWTNWYLAHQQYDQARAAMSNALHYGITLSLTVKWMMTCFVPSIARKLTLKRGSDNAVYSR